MNGMEVSKELKCDIESNQTQLKTAICNHQNILARLKADPDDVTLQKSLNKAEAEIIVIGLEQKNLLERLREEYKAYQKSVNTNLIKNGLEERRFNLTNALNRARKQTIVLRSASATSFSDDSLEHLSPHSSPEHGALNPVEPQDITQIEFLNYFSLATHEAYKEMQNKRAERKRRSTANPHFLYGNKGWDFLTNNKRKRNAFLMSPVSPPHTRQSIKRKQERISPPLPNTTSVISSTPSKSPVKSEQNGNASSTLTNSQFNSFPIIPNLPSGLSIERVSPTGSLSPDNKTCVTCKQSGALTLCEVCGNSFHISCHNRPLTHTPRQCPKCIVKETRTVGSLNVPSYMTVSCFTPAQMSEKLDQKKQLEEIKQSLAAELTQLQDRHSQLTISLKDQKTQQDQLLMTQHSTQDKIKQILSFIEKVKNPLCSEIETIEIS
ncbi:PHD finger protein 21A-like isoform X1 [Diabrotica undecimpunctata]|uniref:PHD finger protein 21A-like isoform X1 n=1 Tax=Diabrotica undecimpunctata TaxID=50387 RepID=UPI003B63803F